MVQNYLGMMSHNITNMFSTKERTFLKCFDDLCAFGGWEDLGEGGGERGASDAERVARGCRVGLCLRR